MIGVPFSVPFSATMNPVLSMLLLLAQEAPGKPKGGGWDVMLLMLAPIVIFFLWMTRSQKKKEQKRKDMLMSARKGDKVVTIGGIHGEISRANEREVVIMVDKSKGIEMRFLRSAIASITNASGQRGGGEGDRGAQERIGEEGGIQS